MKQVSFDKISRGLNYLRAKKYPKCSSIKDLDNVLKTMPACRKAFGLFRDEEFYQDFVQLGKSAASIFVCKQIYNRIEPNAMFFMDGTFGILPLGVKQLLIIMAEVGRKVKQLE